MAFIQYNDIPAEVLKKIVALKAGEKAVYAVNHPGTTLGAVDKNGRTTDISMYGASESIAAKAMLQWKGKTIYLGYETGQKLSGPAGQQQMIPVFGKIEFLGSNDGQLVVGPNDTALYQFLELNPYNQDNVLSLVPANGTYLFKRMKPELDARQQAAVMVKAANVQDQIGKLPDAELLDLARNLDVPTGGEPGEVLVRLLTMAKQEPDRVALAMSDEEAQTRTLLREADELGIVKFSQDRQRWEMCDTGQLICYGLAGQPPLDALVGYIAKNTAGINFRRQMVAAVADKQDTGK